MKDPKPQSEYVLHIRPLPWPEPSPDKRLQSALKTLLRGYGLRVVRCTPVTPKDNASTEGR